MFAENRISVWGDPGREITYKSAKPQRNMPVGIRQCSGNLTCEKAGLLETENRIYEKAIGGRLHCSSKILLISPLHGRIYFLLHWLWSCPMDNVLISELRPAEVSQISCQLSEMSAFLPPRKWHALEPWFLMILSWAKTCGVNLNPTQGYSDYPPQLSLVNTSRDYRPDYSQTTDLVQVCCNSERFGVVWAEVRIITIQIWLIQKIQQIIEENFLELKRTWMFRLKRLIQSQRN